MNGAKVMHRSSG